MNSQQIISKNSISNEWKEYTLAHDEMKLFKKK